MHTIEQFRAMLRVNKHRLDDELEIQGELMDRISTQVVIFNSKMIEAKAELARAEGLLGEEIREAEPKITVGALESKVQRDRNRVGLWQKYQQARATHEAWTGLLDAWRQKGYSIKTLADLYAAQYITLTSTQVSERQRARDENQDDLRASMRKSGHSDRLVDVAKEAAPRRRTLV
jgi:hypothetical protein